MRNVISYQKNLLGIAIGTLGLLSIPLIAMQFTNDVDWSSSDFIIAGALIFSAGLLLNLVRLKVHNRRHRLVLVALVVALFLYIWAELAVGIFTSWGS